MPENNKNNTTSQKEFEVPTPERRNDDITTTETETETGSGTRQQNERKDGNEQQAGTGQKPENQQLGFETGSKDKNDQHKRTDNDKEREERKDTDTPKYQDADWPQDKMNEANNEKGKGVEGKDVDEKGKPRNEKLGVNSEANVSDKNKANGNLGDTRKDSITDRPKTETYEKESGNNTAEAINKANYQHTREEEKRKNDNQNTGGAIKSQPQPEKNKKQNTPQ
jgi:hypothetical protein